MCYFVEINLPRQHLQERFGSKGETYREPAKREGERPIFVILFQSEPPVFS